MFRFTQPRRNVPARRTLAAEPLEERTLLTATGWGGFDPVPEIGVYAVESSELSIDLGGNTDLDLAAAGDMNGDGVTDFLTVNSADSAPVIAVYLGTGSGAYADPLTTELGTVSGHAAAGLLADVTADGVFEYITAAQSASSGRTLDINTYTYADGEFTLKKSSSISLSVFGNYAVYSVASIRLLEIGGDLAIQVENSYAFDTTGGIFQLSGTVVCAGDGTGGFSSPRLVTAFTGTLAGTVTFGSTDYLVSLNKETRTFGFWYYNPAKTAWSSAGSISYTSELGNIAVVSTAAGGAKLWLSGNKSGETLVSEFSLALSAGKVTLASSQAYTLSSVYPAQTVLVSGDLNTDGVNDLILLDSNIYTVLFGGDNGTYTESETTVAQTNYLTSALTDLNGDGVSEILAVGGIGIWTLSLDNISADPVRYALFDTPASAAVTGDFDGDGVLEVAVLESLGGLVAIYDYAGGSYQKVQVVEAPAQLIGGATVTASAAELAVGHFLAAERDQILIRYTWPTGDGDTLLVYDSAAQAQSARLDLIEGETITAMGAGHISSASYTDLAAAVSDGSAVSLVLWGNTAGSLIRKNQVTLGNAGQIAISAVAVGELSGSGRGDVLFLDEGTGEGARLGWLTSPSSTFIPSGLGWGERVTGSGSFAGLELADITGDGRLDAVTTRTYTDSAGETRSVLYMAEGVSSSVAPLASLTAYTFSGDSAAGILFDGGTLTGPAITSYTDSETGLGDILLLKGRTAARVCSIEGGTGEEGFLYLVHASSSDMPTAVLSDLSALDSSYYTWVDEWSSFYVEIWGCANGDEINLFKTAITSDTSLFTAESVESGSGYNAAISIDGGACSVFGSAIEAASPAAGSYVLLARVLYTATATGGAAIPENGVFTASSAGFGADSSSESINGSASCKGSVSTALTELDLFSVRFDSNDDGKIDVADFTLFANNYGLGTSAKPFKNEKAETFNIVSGGGLNVQDFTYFANVYGQTRAKTAADRFYSKMGLDPTSWLAAASALPEIFGEEESLNLPPADSDTRQSAAAPAGSPFTLLAAEEQDEYEWFDFSAIR
ncbi:MAG: VCBS repeat-containing protein [Thermoguttaceae bacterium]|nr:VCBS repeat-containing protein [Thermoguttaceae bacterium]